MWELPLLLLDMEKIVSRAFSKSWQGTDDQWTTAFLGFVFLILLGIVFSIWQRGGVAGVLQWVKERRAAQQAYRQSDAWRRRRLPTLLFWIGVAVLLVLWFNIRQHAP